MNLLLRTALLRWRNKFFALNEGLYLFSISLSFIIGVFYFLVPLPSGNDFHGNMYHVFSFVGIVLSVMMFTRDPICGLAKRVFRKDYNKVIEEHE